MNNSHIYSNQSTNNNNKQLLTLTKDKNVMELNIIAGMLAQDNKYNYYHYWNHIAYLILNKMASLILFVIERVIRD